MMEEVGAIMNLSLGNIVLAKKPLARMASER